MHSFPYSVTAVAMNFLPELDGGVNSIADAGEGTIIVVGVFNTVNGATRWIAVGPFNLQTSEFMKLALVLYMAGYLVRRQLEVAHRVWGVVKPIVLVIFACAMLMVQPDFGTTVVLLMTAFGTIDMAVSAMKRGARDFITKPFSPDVLRVKVNKALEISTLKRDHARLSDQSV